MISYKYRVIVAALLILIGTGLFFTKTEREFINLLPTEGRENTVELSSDKNYQQMFQVNRPSLARIGLHLRPLARNLPNMPVIVTILRADQPLISQEISPQFIDTLGATQIVFESPITTNLGERLTVNVAVPGALSGMIGWQLRRQDGSFDPESAQLSINGVKQADPGAYQAFERTHPALAVQMAGLLAVTTLFVLLSRWLRGELLWVTVGAVGLSIIFCVPSILLGQWPWLLIFTTITALESMYFLMRKHAVGVIPALFAANIFAFTSWFSLHLGAGHFSYSIFALLPLVFLPLKNANRKLTRLIAIILVIVIAIILLKFENGSGDSLNVLTAHSRDVFLDPNQAPSANPIGQYSVTWQNFGSYIGIPAFVLAIIGILLSSLSFPLLSAVGLLSAIIALQAHTATLISPLIGGPTSHLIIITTFTLAFFAGCGLQRLKVFLGQHDRFITGLITIIVVLSLLDIWHVAATVLEFYFASLP